MQQFANEIAAISRRQVIDDDRVRRIEVFNPSRFDLGAIDFEGGRTDFTPLLDAADQYRPDIGVVLTDLQGPARFQPNARVGRPQTQ
jgi:hypothetical protein